VAEYLGVPLDNSSMLNISQTVRSGNSISCYLKKIKHWRKLVN